MPGLYGGAEAITQPLTQATGQVQTGIQDRFKQFMGRTPQQDLAMSKKRAITGHMMKESINTFGVQALMGGEEELGSAVKQMDTELKEIRIKMTQARHENDKQLYQSMLKRELYLRELKQKAEMSRKAGIGQLLVGVATAVASILGAVVGSVAAPGVGTAVGASIGGAAGGMAGRTIWGK